MCPTAAFIIYVPKLILCRGGRKTALDHFTRAEASHLIDPGLTPNTLVRPKFCIERYEFGGCLIDSVGDLFPT